WPCTSRDRAGRQGSGQDPAPPWPARPAVRRHLLVAKPPTGQQSRQALPSRPKRYVENSLPSSVSYLTFAIVSCAMADSVACAEFSPRRKSLSENVVNTSVGWCQ